MGDLAVDTTPRPTGPSTFGCDLSPDWEIWGPNGGYLASVAMRAAGVASGRARPASINAHFVGAGQSAPVDISVQSNRETKVASSVTARITQEGRPPAGRHGLGRRRRPRRDRASHVTSTQRRGTAR